jgi:hypothetical protein
MSIPPADPPLSVFDTTNEKRRDKLLNTLQQISPQIVFKPLGKGIIQIPPDLTVFYLTSDDLNHGSYQEFYINRIIPFLTQYPKRILLFEGFHLIKEKKQAFLAELTADLFLNHHIGIIPTRNTEDTMQCLRSLARREQIRDQPPHLGRIKPKSRTLLDSQATLLEGLLQCGPKKQKELISNFSDPISIFDAIVDTPEKILAIMGFGEKFIDQNQKLLNTNLLLKKSN